MIHVCLFRLKLMYRGIPVRILALIVVLLVAFLLSGLYGSAEEASKLKIGVHFERPTPLTREIMASLSSNEILSPAVMTVDEGLTAVRENRIEGLFVFKEGFEAAIEEENFEDMVEVYFLDENYLPYLLTDIVGSELIGELAVSTALHYFEGALEAVGRTEAKNPEYMRELHEKGKSQLHIETDNFYVKKTYINENNITVDDVVLDNVLLFRQIIFGVVYIFAVFYMMFLAVSIVRDREMGLGRRWFMTGLNTLGVFAGEYLSIIIGAMPIVLAITVVEVWYEGHWLFYFSVNVLFVMAYSALLYLLTYLMEKVTVFVLVTTALILVLGIISGSFFALDTENTGMLLLTTAAPAYRLLMELTNQAVLSFSKPSEGYVSYMLLFSCALLGAAWAMRLIRRHSL